MTTELEALKKRVEELEAAAKPPEPFDPGPRFQFDPTANFSMPPSALRAMVNAIPESLMGELRGDARRPNPVTAPSSTLTTAPQTQAVQRGSGWREPAPLEVPGLKYVDELCEAQDHLDLLERAEKLAKAEAIKASK